MSKHRKAPGRPGKTPPWTHGSKRGIGKALDAGSHISFSISEGAVTESYYPREDNACLGESAFIITDGKKFYSDERKDAHHQIDKLDSYAPGYLLVNKCKQERYTITKEIIADPLRNSLLQKVRFDDHGHNNLKLHHITIPRFPENSKLRRAFVQTVNGVEMLFAETDGLVVAVTSSRAFSRRSVGFLGKSDGISQLQQHGWLKHEYDLAEMGNVILSFEISPEAGNEFLLITAWGHAHQEAAHNALASLLTGFTQSKKHYIASWQHWHNKLWTVPDEEKEYPLLRSSAITLRVSESKLFPGGILASLSIPWGHTRVENGLGAYHLVWPRDLVLSSGGFAALNDTDSLLRVLNYLMTTQLENGSWPQNMWLDGAANWNGIQLDQVAMPITLVDLCRQHELVSESQLKRYWTRLKKSLEFLITTGPVSEQDRWEEESGINTFSLATQVSAFVSGANLAAHFGETDLQQLYFTEADNLNARIEELTYVTDTPLSREFGVPGYYIRINPGLEPADKIKNKKLKFRRPGSRKMLRVYECVGVDTLALVRFGLRSPHDPKIINTIKIIDALLKVELPNGISWRRYVGDIYGEDEKGNEYQEQGDKGIGRPWPLLTGERAHYEIAAGNFEYARILLGSMNNFADNGFLPEQVWDGEDIIEKKLLKGKPTGSAMPLTWAHSEYIKLCRSLADKQVFDMPISVYERYVGSSG
ncbi:MAG: glucan 1,4-alpha-glucosidase [Chitinophagaceae bacterium]|nr:MAG: glucan 1,4-alpha-glucosidase [Chitinophagaceae bacterium]